MNGHSFYDFTYSRPTTSLLLPLQGFRLSLYGEEPAGIVSWIYSYTNHAFRRVETKRIPFLQGALSDHGVSLGEHKFFNVSNKRNFIRLKVTKQIRQVRDQLFF